MAGRPYRRRPRSRYTFCSSSGGGPVVVVLVVVVVVVVLHFLPASKLARCAHRYVHSRESVQHVWTAA